MQTCKPSDRLVNLPGLVARFMRRLTAAKATAVVILAVIAGFAGLVNAEPPLHALAADPDSSASTLTLAAGAGQRTPGGDDELRLLAAVAAQRVPAVRRLLTTGADPDRTNRFGESSLHIAAEGDPGIIEALLDAGANPNARDAGGVTPLMLAAGAGRETSIARLLSAGARLDMKDYQGSSVADWASRGGHSALAARLEAEIAAAAEASGDTPSALEFAEDVFVDVQFPDWFKISFLDLGEDLDEAIDAGKQGILLFISASRCSYCKAFMQTSLKAPDIRRCLNANFDIILRDRALVTKCGRSSPTTCSAGRPTCSTAVGCRRSGRCWSSSSDRAARPASAFIAACWATRPSAG